MLDEFFFIKLTNENCREFIYKMKAMLKVNEEFIITIDLDCNQIQFNDSLYIDIVDIPEFLIHKNTVKPYFKLMNKPKVDKKDRIVLSLVKNPPATNLEFLEGIEFFEDKILKKYNVKYKKKYEVAKNEFKLSPKVKIAFDKYIKALEKGVNKSDRIEFYRFVIACHQYRSKINEVTFRQLIEKENVRNIDDECNRFFDCLEFYKFAKGKL